MRAATCGGGADTCAALPPPLPDPPLHRSSCRPTWGLPAAAPTKTTSATLRSRRLQRATFLPSPAPGTLGCPPRCLVSLHNDQPRGMCSPATLFLRCSHPPCLTLRPHAVPCRSSPSIEDEEEEEEEAGYYYGDADGNDLGESDDSYYGVSFAEEDAQYAAASAAPSPAATAAAAGSGGDERTGLGVAGVLRRLRLWAREYSDRGLILLEAKEITRWCKEMQRCGLAWCACQRGPSAGLGGVCPAVEAALVSQPAVSMFRPSCPALLQSCGAAVCQRLAGAEAVRPGTGGRAAAAAAPDPHGVLRHRCPLHGPCRSSAAHLSHSRLPGELPSGGFV